MLGSRVIFILVLIASGFGCGSKQVYTIAPAELQNSMTSMESLVALVGQPVDAAAVQALIASERLQSSIEEDLEEGEPVRSHLSSPSGGYVFSHTLGRINTLFVHVKAKGEYAAFPGALVHGLTPRSTRAEVRRILGTPSRSGEPQTLPPLGRYGAWDRFDTEALSLHFQYSEPEQQIELITAMTPDIAPGGAVAR